MAKRTGKLEGFGVSGVHTTTSRVRDQAKMVLARKLHRALIEKGWSAAELARKSGLTRDNISTYMRMASLPTEESLLKLARALGVEPKDLMPNRSESLVDPDNPTMEIVTSPDRPGKAWLRVNQLVSFTTATKIAEMLQSDHAQADRAAGGR